jgi:hypothetical protein
MNRQDFTALLATVAFFCPARGTPQRRVHPRPPALISVQLTQEEGAVAWLSAVNMDPERNQRAKINRER